MRCKRGRSPEIEAALKVIRLRFPDPSPEMATDVRGVLMGLPTTLFGFSTPTLADEVFPDSVAVQPMRDLLAS